MKSTINYQKQKGAFDMNFLISFIFSTSLLANAVINISYGKKNEVNANIIKNRLLKHYKIPEILISLNQGQCNKASSKRIELCVENDGNLKIEQKNSELISSLQIFNRPY